MQTELSADWRAFCATRRRYGVVDLRTGLVFRGYSRKIGPTWAKPGDGEGRYFWASENAAQTAAELANIRNGENAKDRYRFDAFPVRISEDGTPDARDIARGLRLLTEGRYMADNDADNRAA
jgi:hypothetical protein